MVSPSKIFKASSSGFKVGKDSSKKNGLKTHGASKQRSSSSQVKNSCLLANTKFYLDIRNRAQLAKVESTLKSYGAKIEVFFRKDIKVVVTDRADWIGNGQSPTSTVSPLTTPSPSSNQDQRFAVPKSRASAMLEKVSRQPTTSPYSSPLELAQKWRIPVLPVPGLWKWIAKVEDAFANKLDEKKKEKEFLDSKIVVYARDSPFIKIESFVSPNKPEFFEFGTWPKLNLDGYLGQCPFLSPSPPSPSNEQSLEAENKFDVKNKVAVELIQYDTDFRIKDNYKIGECEEGETEENKISRNEDQNNFGLNGVLNTPANPHYMIALKNDSGRMYDMTELMCWLPNGVPSGTNLDAFIARRTKMTRRLVKNNLVSSEEEVTNFSDSKQNLSPLCNGHASRNITRQSSQELLKVQCNGLSPCHRNSKLLSPSGSDVLPLPTSRRSTRRASASWCGSTRELAQLSPTDSEIDNIRRSDSSFESQDPVLDSPGITLRPKEQLWLPVALIGTTAEENGNCIRKRSEYSVKQPEIAKLSSDLLEPLEEKTKDDNEGNQAVSRVSKDSDSSLNSTYSSQNEYQIKKNSDKKDTYCIITRNTKIKNEEINGGSRESSIESHRSEEDQLKNRCDNKKRSLSVCGRLSPSVKRNRTMSTNSVQLVGRKKKLSPEEKLLQDNKDYFKMEVLNTRLRSSGSHLIVNQNKESDGSEENTKPVEKIDKIIIKKIRVKGRRRRSRWAKANEKKGDDVNYASLLIENKKNNNIKINGVIKRKRQTELMKLCNEAESFMFGESSRQGTTGMLNTEEVESGDFSRKKNCLGVTAEVPVKLENSGETDCASVGKARKKRRSHAEAFIHDNLDYYKFETPGSRLRYQGSLSDVKSEDKDFIYTLKQRRKDKMMNDQNKKSELLEKLQINTDLVKEEKVENLERRRNVSKPSGEIEKILFSFERVPATEPWYEVYKRQDEGMENYYPLLSDPNDQPFLLPYELPKPTYPKVSAASEYYKRRRKKFLNLFNHPRKSPRCHASTLAILSSLKKRKRRSGTNISMNSMSYESSPPASSNPTEEKYDLRRQIDSEKNEAEYAEMLNCLFSEDSNGDADEILLEPVSDSESKPKRKSSDSCKSVKSDEEDGKNAKSCSRGKKPAKSESESDSTNSETKHFLVQCIKPETFSKDMVIETGKKSGLKVNISTILEEFKKCKSMDESDADLISDLNGGSVTGRPIRSNRGRRKKVRKINKTGWDNRKSRRRTGNSADQGKEVTVNEVESETRVQEGRIKTKVRVRRNGLSSENIIPSGKRRVRRKRVTADRIVPDGGGDDDQKPVLRSHLETTERGSSSRRVSQETDSPRSESADAKPSDYPPCMVRVKKISDPNISESVKLGRRYNLQKRRLVLSRKKKRVIDYAWTTKKRR